MTQYSESVRLRQGGLYQVHPVILHPAGTTGYEPELAAAIVSAVNRLQDWLVNVTGKGLSFGPLNEIVLPALLVIPDPSKSYEQVVPYIQQYLSATWGWPLSSNLCHAVILRGSGGYAGYSPLPEGRGHLVILGDAFCEALLGHYPLTGHIMGLDPRYDYIRATTVGAIFSLCHELLHLVGLDDEHDPSVDTIMGHGLDEAPRTTLTGAEMLRYMGSKWPVRGA